MPENKILTSRIGVDIPVARWFSCERETCPDLHFIDPLLRRRLSSLARMTLGAAYACADGIEEASIVFASRHGELCRTTTLLENIADGDVLSPTLFSLSVLNASTGLFSICQKNTAPATAISAGSASFGFGLLDAALRLAENPARPVLYVYADEPVPAVYGHSDTPDDTHALGILLTAPARFWVSCSMDGASASPDTKDEMPSRAFLRCLEHGQAQWCAEGRGWLWERMERA